MRQKSQKRTTRQISAEEKAILKDVGVQKSLLQLIKALIPHTFIFLTREGRALFSPTTSQNNKEILLEVLADKRAQKIGEIVRAALDVPPGVPKKKHHEATARLFGVSSAQLYRYLFSFRSEGIVGLMHKSKKTKL